VPLMLRARPEAVMGRKLMGMVLFGLLEMARMWKGTLDGVEDGEVLGVVHVLLLAWGRAAASESTVRRVMRILVAIVVSGSCLRGRPYPFCNW